jgi:hypothetical protein
MGDKERKEESVIGASLCDCGKAGEDNHSCPFADEIHNDRTTMCNCCKDCQSECARSI